MSPNYSNSQDSRLISGFRSLGLASSPVSFFLGCTALINISSSGQLFLGELLMGFLALIALFEEFVLLPKNRVLSNPFFLTFIFALGISLFGYIVSDIWMETVPADYIRGWARLVFLVIDIYYISFLAFRNSDHLWWYCVGLGFGMILYLYLSGLDLSTANWKTGYGLPISILVMAIAPKISSRYSALVLAFLGLFHVLFDFRSLGFFCLLVAGLIWLTPRLSSKQDAFRALPKLIISFGLIFTLLSVAYSFSQDSYANRRDESNSIRSAAYIVSLQAIAESPLIGHGSWAKDSQLASRYVDIITAEAGTRRSQYKDQLREELIPAHSQILQSWVEGGILGTIFFAYFGFKHIRGIRFCVIERPFDRFTALFLFLLISSFWAVFASPFGGNQRIYVAISVAILCVLERERKRLLRAT